MSEMIERVAKAIYPDAFDPNVSCDDPNCPECNNHKIEARKMARAAIEAMREPTDEQRNEYFKIMRSEGFGETTSVFNDPDWNRMIDAALKE